MYAFSITIALMNNGLVFPIVFFFAQYITLQKLLGLLRSSHSDHHSHLLLLYWPKHLHHRYYQKIEIGSLRLWVSSIVPSVFWDTADVIWGSILLSNHSIVSEGFWKCHLLLLLLPRVLLLFIIKAVDEDLYSLEFIRSSRWVFFVMMWCYVSHEVEKIIGYGFSQIDTKNDIETRIVLFLCFPKCYAGFLVEIILCYLNLLFIDVLKFPD